MLSARARKKEERRRGSVSISPRRGATTTRRGNVLAGGTILHERRRSQSNAETIQQFGPRSKGEAFDARAYVQSVFQELSVFRSAAHRDELRKRRAETASELKESVERHHQTLIATAREIITIEADMTEVTATFREFQGLTRALGEASIVAGDDDDDAAALRHGRGLLHRHHHNNDDDDDDDAKDEEEQRRRHERARARHHRRSLTDAKLEAIQSVEELLEELESHTKERSLEEAVSTLEQATARIEELSARAAQPLQRRLQAREKELLTVLSRDLAQPTTSKHMQRKLIEFMVRLDRGSHALQLFLTRQALAIKAAIRALKLSGDVSAYVLQLSQVVFGAVAQATAEFQRLFPDRASLAAFTAWASGEVKSFAHLFHRHVFHTDATLANVAVCLRYAFSECSTLERSSVGMSMGFVLVRLLDPGVFEVVRASYARVGRAIFKELERDAWQTSTFFVQSARKRTASGSNGGGGGGGGSSSSSREIIKLTGSACFLYEQIQGLLRDFRPVVEIHEQHAGFSPDLYHAVVSGMEGLLNDYIQRMVRRVKAGDLGDADMLGPLGNAYYLAADLLPRISHEFKKHFHTVCRELDAYKARLMRLFDALRLSYCQKRSVRWVNDEMRWGQLRHARYENDEEADGVGGVSQGAERLVKHLRFVAEAVAERLDEQSVAVVVKGVYEQVLTLILQDDAIEFAHETGRERYVRDMCFLARAHRAFLTAEDDELMKKLLHRADPGEGSASFLRLVDDVKAGVDRLFREGAAAAVEAPQPQDEAKTNANSKAKKKKKNNR